mgnify:CR=1 FL=1
MGDVLARRRAEGERLLGLAREYVRRLSSAVRVRAAWVVGSVARGDFNVWSDVDVVVVSDALPERIPDRAELLAADAPPGVQAVGYSSDGFRAALRRGDPLAVSAVREGVILRGGGFFRGSAQGFDP